MAGEEIIYDSLCITDQQRYTGGFDDWCGGRGIYGRDQSYEAGDDFVIESACTITSVTVSYIVPGIAGDPEAVCVAFYELLEGGRPEEAPAWSASTADFEVHRFSDTLFGLLGKTITARIACPLRASRWVVVMQPIGDDWGYALSSPARPPCGGDAAVSGWVRRSDESPCCPYDCDSDCIEDWTRTDELDGGQWSTLAMRVATSGCTEPQGACCFDDGRCEFLGEPACTGEGGVFQGDGTVCNVQCLCPVLKRLSAKCKDRNRIRAAVRFIGTVADGKTISISIDGEAFSVLVEDGRGTLRTRSTLGPHTVALADPDCGESVEVECLP
ncbi:MAG: hypothetical protein IT449_10185 [Phycisphaerales bacterium]|nr:hypothetical protein [Phycisphaerales bacterium]